MQDAEIIESLQSSAEEFLTDLRMRRGVNEVALEKLKRDIAAATEHWEGKSDVPKDLAAVMVDLFASTKDNEVLYKNEPDVMDRISDAAGDLQELVYQLFA